MKTYEKLHYEPVSDPFKMPMPQFSTMDCSCIRCGAITRLPVPVEFTDWQRVSEDYMRAYESMGRNVQQLFEEAGRIFDAPLKEWLEAKHAHLMMQLEDILSQHNANSDAAESRHP
jgi:hypothetical protein